MSGICAVLGFILLMAWMLFRLVEVQRREAERIEFEVTQSAQPSVQSPGSKR